MDGHGPNDIHDDEEGENYPVEENEEQPHQEGADQEENLELDDEGENGGNEDMEGDMEDVNDGENGNPSGSGGSVSDPNNPPAQMENNQEGGEQGEQEHSHVSESESQKVENESLYSYDENKDFPVFANKINKKWTVTDLMIFMMTKRERITQ